MITVLLCEYRLKVHYILNFTCKSPIIITFFGFRQQLLKRFQVVLVTNNKSKVMHFKLPIQFIFSRHFKICTIGNMFPFNRSNVN